MHLHIKVADDKELSKIELELANQDGSHNHNFHYNDSETISGTEYEWSDELSIPATAPDMLWFHVTVTDAEGKAVNDSFMFHFDN